jgi:RNA binding exosome subunit
MLDIFISRKHNKLLNKRCNILPQLPIAYIDIRFCAHATEDPDKVLKAAYNLFPEETIEELTFDKSNVEGHYGNPITFFEKRIKNTKTIKALIENLSANLSSLDKTNLEETLDRCVEKGSLFLRIDKQAAFRGKIKLGKSDPIRIRIRFRKNKREDVTKICKEIGMLP